MDGANRRWGELEPFLARLLNEVVIDERLRVKVLATTSYPLPDLAGRGYPGFREYDLGGLEPEAGVALLRNAGVTGDDETLHQLVQQAEGHPLTLSLFASYLSKHHHGDPGQAPLLISPSPSDATSVPTALRALLNRNSDQLAEPERDLLARLAFAPNGLTSEEVQKLADAGGPAGGAFSSLDRESLHDLIQKLLSLSLISGVYRGGAESHLTVHPAVRDHFLRHLGSRESEVRIAMRAILMPS
jgi:hypothetical protein